LNQGARTARTHFFRRTEARAALAALCLLVGCDVYNQGLLDGAIGDAGGSGLGARGGSSTTGGTSGSAGNGGLFTGGTSGAGAVGGAVSTGGSQGGGGSSGEGGEGDQDSGGTSGGGQGGTSTGGASGDSGTAGQGGMSGGSGGAGNTGGGVGGDGAGTSGTGGGGAGSGGGAGTGGSSEVCTGCARLSVPLAASADQAHFTITLPAATDFSVATIALRVARYAGTGGWFKAYIQEGSPNYLYQDSVETTIASIGTSMQTISWDVATAGTTADKTIIRRIGIEISGNGASSWTNPTVLYVDSITVTGTTLAMSSFTFDTSNTVSTTPTGSGPNNVIWLNNFSGDTNVTGATLSWLGP
jgi:hypothetical protein